MKKRVLLVDDEEGIRTSLKMILEPTYEVICAARGIKHTYLVFPADAAFRPRIDTAVLERTVLEFFPCRA